MGVTGDKALLAALTALPGTVRAELTREIEAAGEALREEMTRLTPRDAANPGPHAADGFRVVTDDDGLGVRVGLPTPEDVTEYFWFRFIDLGTQGGAVRYRRSVGAGHVRRPRRWHIMNVPSRPALHIRARALDGMAAEIRARIGAAVARALEQA